MNGVERTNLCVRAGSQNSVGFAGLGLGMTLQDWV